MDETLRLQFGTASNTIGTQWYKLQKYNETDMGLQRRNGTPRVIAFEAKGRVQRKLRLSAAQIQKQEQQAQQSTWGGQVQVFNHAEVEEEDQSMTAEDSDEKRLWDWHDFEEKNLFEVEEFRSHMSLQNFYEGGPVTRDGTIANTTLDNVEERIRLFLEETDNLKSIQCLVDMDSCWGGFAHEVMTYLTEECPGTVVITFGNDWKYPLASQAVESIYGLGPEIQDKGKIDARRKLNIVSSLWTLNDISNVFIPLGIGSANMNSHHFPSLRFDRSSLSAVSSLAAAGLETVMSPYISTSVYDLLEGVLPSCKFMDISAQFPVSSSQDPELYFAKESQVLKPFSLLPAYPLPGRRKNRMEMEKRGPIEYKSRFRRVHFRGNFTGHENIEAMTLQRSVESSNFSYDSTQLDLPSWYDIQEYRDVNGGSVDLAGESINTISQLSLSSDVGVMLTQVDQGLGLLDKRILHEYTSAGMNPDALDEFHSFLQTSSEPYFE